MSNLSRRPAGQRGVVLFVALIVLVVMTLAGLGLMRQMGAGTSIAGNVAFKENATSAADLGVEQAITWILDTAKTDPAKLDSDDLDQGYRASWEDGAVDPTKYDWSDGATGAAGGLWGNSAQYVVHRLCKTKDMGPSEPGQVCSDSYFSVIAGASMGGCSYGTCLPTPIPGPFYRITSRVIGPRNAVSYVQVLIN